ncbi:papain-like cysteine protease family protein [Pseudomonas capsici]|uniref:Peptidase C39-like domain-containing protein n=1 Tax=Pseudomonas capsici TaxID=2810614 RepID=A0ABT3BY39_9PSED|nr:papain-like cysteine protease family protein [Pseudomonas capsici]MBX8607814.1 hypothetical protein [Pseudomonas cichorii]MBN6714788.1 hypothetical protein [Pseudomonas capsici]MBN6719859.1 hypothetical protein [Pseudomonas capsici]MBN6724309.1 hypothetical protein [Pseudomonas capsici]MCV4268514.1 hypothetical protein [Pseudomonas capsici]
MAILYNIPRIGAGSPNKWGQRGPTCWYYVSKTLLKFHDMIQPASEHYESFKTMHELRSVLTQMGELEPSGNRNDKNIVIDRLATRSHETLRKINGRSQALAQLRRKLRTASAASTHRLQQHIDTLEKLLEGNRTEHPRRIAAIEALRSYEDNDLSRAKIFESFFPDGTFRIVQADVWSGDKFTPELLEECLANWGPCYAGGEFSVKTIDRSGADTKAGDRVVNVSEFRTGSAHAIVIAGIDGNTVYYKDPNHSDELATCSFQHLAKHISKADNRLFIAVNCTPDPLTGRCSHMKTKALVRPDWE